MKRVILIILSCTLLLFGCSSPVAIGESVVHGGKIEKTQTIFYQNGKSEYAIVREKDCSESELLAVEEIVSIVRKATGITLPVLTDDKSYGEKIISVGETTALKKANIAPLWEKIGSEGYELHTVGKSLYLAGRDEGAINGAYELLYHLVGFRQYNAHYCSLSKENEGYLPDLSVREVPDFSHRVASYGSTFLREQPRRRMRTTTLDEIFIEGGGVHNILRTILPSDTSKMQFDYRIDHPKWFSEDEGNQLCYTARGDDNEYARLVEEIAKKVKEMLEKDKEHGVFSITQMDNADWCGCNACSRIISECGSAFATQVPLINDIVESLDGYLKEQNREVEFVLFSYQASATPPTVLPEKLNDKVSVWVAPVSANYVDGEEEIATTLSEWNKHAKSVWFWGYDTFFHSYLTPYNTYGSMQEILTSAKRESVSLVWMQGSYNASESTGFDDLKNYLYSRLTWNAEEKIDELIDDYFTAVYREGAEDMKRAFDLLLAEFDAQKSKNLPTSIWTVTVDSEWWSKDAMEEMLALMDSAKEKVKASLLQDPEFYEIVTKNINRERIFPRLILNKAYGREDESLLSDALSLSITMFSEVLTLEDYFS